MILPRFGGHGISTSAKLSSVRTSTSMRARLPICPAWQITREVYQYVINCSHGGFWWADLWCCPPPPPPPPSENWVFRIDVCCGNAFSIIIRYTFLCMNTPVSPRSILSSPTPAGVTRFGRLFTIVPLVSCVPIISALLYIVGLTVACHHLVQGLYCPVSQRAARGLLGLFSPGRAF